MGIAPLGQLIRLPASVRHELNLKTGDIVTVNILKEISPKVWAIGIRGVVFRARSGEPLFPGDALSARVVKSGAAIELRLISSHPPSLAAALRQTGLESDPATMLLAAALMRSNVKIEPPAVRALRTQLEKLKGDPERNARALSLLAAKGLPPDSPALGELVALMAHGEGEGGERRQGKERKPAAPAPEGEEVAALLKEAVQQALARAPGLLALANHLGSLSGDPDWIVVPFRLSRADWRLEGTLRFLYDRYGKKVRSIVVVAETPQGDRSRFLLRPEGNGFRMSVFSNQARWRGVNVTRWAEAVAKLGKLGVVCDDSINDEAACDGFEPRPGGSDFHGVDTEG